MTCINLNSINYIKNQGPRSNPRPSYYFAKLAADPLLSVVGKSDFNPLVVVIAKVNELKHIVWAKHSIATEGQIAAVLERKF